MNATEIFLLCLIVWVVVFKDRHAWVKSYHVFMWAFTKGKHKLPDDEYDDYIYPFER